jgi:predicted nucleic acid-binding protein
VDFLPKQIYVETTIPSFYYTFRTDPEAIARRNWTRTWWSTVARSFTLVTSLAVIAEIQRGTSAATHERLSLLRDLPLLDINEEVEEITRIYIEKKAVPRDPVGDALHLALATYHRVDVLLTWNCRHLANPNKLEHIRIINYHLGFGMPLLTTPLNYLGGEEDNE